MVSFGHAAYLGIGGYAVGILAHEGVGLRLRAMAGGAAAGGAVRARHRRAVAAHARRLFHHDHARLRADGLLHRRRARRATAATTASPSTSAASSSAPIDLSNKTQFYYLCLALLFGAHLPGLAAGQFALRHGDPGRALQRRAHARHRLSDLPLPARLLRHRRHAVRAGRRAARQSHRFRQPGDDVLDALGRPHRHGGARRHGLAVRPGDRRGRRCWCWRRLLVRHHRNIGRSSSGRCCCWSCCSRAAASTACWQARREGAP